MDVMSMDMEKESLARYGLSYLLTFRYINLQIDKYTCVRQ